MSHPVDEDTLMEDESHHFVAEVPRPVGPDPSGSPGGFEPSAKLRASIEKLAHWRIDPTSIDFDEGKAESHGGHATVSRGNLNMKGIDMRDMEKRALGKKMAGDRMNYFLWEREKMKKARWPKKEVAVKKMRVADDMDFERILGLAIREAELLAELNHPNIVELEGFVEDACKGIVWLVFPWSFEGNLKDVIAKEKWEIPERISLINDVAKGLEYLHTRSAPICHGDLKSLNVLIDCDWDEFECHNIWARIADFGSARRLPRRDPSTQIEEMVTRLPSAEPPTAAFRASTKTITLTGNKYTLRWAAPELLLEDQLSLWSGIWAMGWIIYEVITGSLPFEDAASDMVVVERVLEGKLPSLADHANILLVDELCSLVNTCWEMQPTKRPTAGSCRRSFEKMPILAPGMDYLSGRILDCDRLRKLGHMYQSRGAYATAFTFFVDALKRLNDDECDDHYDDGYYLRYEVREYDRVQTMRDIAQLARLGKEDSAIIAVYDLIRKVYRESDEEESVDLDLAFLELAKVHQLGNEGKKAWEIDWEDEKIQGWNRRARVLLDEAHELRDREDPNFAISVYTEALTISVNICDGKGRADALWGLAEVCRLQNGYEEAIPLYSEVLKVRTDLNDRKGRADALRALADVHRRRSEYEKAISLSSEVLEIRADLNDEEGRADALWGLADVHRRRNECKEAIPLYSEALKISTDRGHRKGIADALHGLADVHRLGGEYEEAITLYYKALGIFTEINDKRGKAAALLGLAAMRHDQGGEGDNLCQLVAEIIEPPRKLTDPASDDERLLRLRTRVLDWLVGRLRSFASDLENGTPRGTASDPGVSLQEVHIGSVDKSPSKIDAR